MGLQNHWAIPFTLSLVLDLSHLFCRPAYPQSPWFLGTFFEVLRLGDLVQQVLTTTCMIFYFNWPQEADQFFCIQVYSFDPLHPKPHPVIWPTDFGVCCFMFLYLLHSLYTFFAASMLPYLHPSLILYSMSIAEASLGVLGKYTHDQSLRLAVKKL